MKTHLLNFNRFFIFFSLGIAGIVTTSCGSFQNSSYYDNDGIYGDSEKETNVVTKKTSHNYSPKENVYSQKFKNMQNDFGYFTDVDNYTSAPTSDTIVTSYQREYNSNQYAGWGNNNNEVVVNYYNYGWDYPYSYWGGYYRPYHHYYGWNNYGWSVGYSWGWNSPYYGYYNYGYGYPYYSYYPYGYGYYNNYYPYYRRNIVRNSGPRGSRNGYYRNQSGTTGRYSTRNSGYSSPKRFNSSTTRSTSTPRRNNYYSSPTRSTPSTRSTSTPRRNNYYNSPTRSTPSTRSTSTPRRNNHYNSSRRSSGSYSSPSRGSSRSSSSRSSGRR